MVFGITGGIATGKSTVSAMLAELGAVIIDADQVAREVVEPGSPGLEAIRQRFGDGYLLQDGGLDRTKLGSLVFADSQALAELNAITHPLIRQSMDQKVKKALEADPQAVVIMDIPLLIESMVKEQAQRVDQVILVYVPREIQLERLMARDNLTPHEAHLRLSAQMPIEEKKKYADYMIDNSGRIEDTKRQALVLMDKLREQLHREKLDD